MKFKIVTVVGARPQLIKASVVSSAIAAAGEINEIVVHTGQHFDPNMSDVFFSDLGMSAPAHSLGIHGGSHAEMTAKMLVGLERVLLAEQPHAVLVYGDTNSTLAAALAAAKLNIPIAHVEAGLRSFNTAMPEEVNRIVTDRISTWLFAPTALAVHNLGREGVPPEQIIHVGDVMYDVALHYGARAASKVQVLPDLGIASGAYVLATIHRAENTDVLARLGVIIDALLTLSRDIPVVWPIHPRTRKVLRDNDLYDTVAGELRLIEPVGYLGMVELEKHAAVIVTDSGGVQKEAFFHEIPCVTLRDETEWMELVESGWNRLVPPMAAASVHSAITSAIGTRGARVRPYGDGDASRRIAAELVLRLSACA